MPNPRAVGGELMITLQRKQAGEVTAQRRSAINPAALAEASVIMEDVRRDGWEAAVAHGLRLGDVTDASRVIFDRKAMREALDGLDVESRGILERTAERVRSFARAQRACLVDLDISIAGGSAGHRVRSLEFAGCYAPGGRFPLPSSVIMTAATACAAGVATVIVASPRPTQVTLAAAAVAGADVLVALGGAQAIGVLTFGARVGAEWVLPRCDVVVGPGNKWVTAAKHIATRYTMIDMLAGPSEVLIIADETADPRLVAADMIAQAEHDADAAAVLVTTCEGLVARVERELMLQLEGLSTAATARAALRENSYVIVAGSLDEAVAASEAIAPEHLEVMTKDAEGVARRLKQYGAVFIGSRSAEVFGDYGAGPNHVLPTGGLARSVGGLSVLNFMKVQTYLVMTEGGEKMRADAAGLARLEGLEGHARAAEARDIT